MRGCACSAKTTTPEWGAYPATETGIYGITRNPWNLDYTAGGGMAAARLRQWLPGVVPAAHGGDGGGSIRLTRAQLRRVRAETHAQPQQLRVKRIGGVAGFGMRPCVDPQRARDSAVLLDIAA